MVATFYASPFPTLDIHPDYWLREHTIDDAQHLLAYTESPEVFQYILADRPKTLLDAMSEVHYCQQLFRKKQGVYWAIVEKKTNQMIGGIGFYINNYHRRGEISYDLAVPYWQQGIMTAAVSAVVDLAFSKIGLHRIEAIILEENVASAKLLTKTGFAYESRRENYKFFEEKTHSVACYVNTPGEG